MAEHPDVEQVPRAELWKCFVSAMTAMSKVYCVIDALDEMEAGSDNFLEDIVQLAQQKPSSVKLAMASRQLPHIEAVFKGQSSVDIRLEKRMIDKDIVTYITHRLKTQQLRVLSDEDQQAIKEAICSKGQSLFLYARLMIAEVLQHSQSLHAQLSQLPGSLSDMYTNTLNEHSVRSGVTHQFQLFVLQWVTHCSRPLRLIELAIITNFMPGFSGFKDLQDAKRAVRTACGPLLEILEDESVQVIHHSFTEFLLDVERSRNLQEPDTHGYFPIITPSATHLMMAAICVDYLSSGCFESWSVESRSKEPQTCGWRRSLEKPHKNQLLRYPFLQYASQNWPLHVASCDGLNAGLRSRLDDFLRDGSHDFESWKDFWFSFAFCMPEDFSPLHVAAQCGLAAYAKHLLEIGVSPDLRDGFGRTPISYASAQGHSGTLSMLLDHHAQPSIEDHLGLAPIHYSAKANHAKALHILLMVGVNPMTPELKADPYLECDGSVSTLGYTPIYYACQLGNVQAAAELLKCIDPKDIENGLLHLAAEKGRAEVVSLLLQHEQIAASIDSIDKLGDTPLFLAASARDPATIRILLKHGADVNARSEGIPNRWHATHATRIIWRKRNLTPLHGWAKSPTYPKGQDSSIAELAMSAKLLIEGGCDVNATDDQGQTALFSWTEQCNHVEAFVSILLKHGANPSAIDETGSTPLHYLRRRKSEGVLNLLVKSGADIDAVSRDGRTPLIAAAAGQYLQTEIFKEHGADFNHTDEDGNTALHFACRSWCLEQSDMKKWLAVANPTVQNNLGHTCLFNLPWNNGAELVDSIPLLMHRGVDLETRDHLGRTALLHAACNGAKTFVQGLVQHGADVTAKDFQGKRVLHLLATSRVCYYDAGAADIQEKVKLIRSLVEAGADIQAVDHAGNTIFHDAASWNENWGHVRTALEAIVKAGGVANLPNLDGRTGLHCAIALKEDDESSRTACIGFATRIDFLLQPSLAFDINARDHEGITPLHLASSVSEVNVWKLIRAGADIRAIDFQG
ncbi:MAG: hypothetical protein M1830_003524, partial [Pleopsidium flavum]